jgi:hypothetical protein
MVSMRFDVRDIFRSCRVAFSFQRLWIQFVGLFFGYLGYVILTYLGLILSGKNFGVLWSRFGLLPSVAGYPLPWTSWILFGAGCFILLFSWLVASTGVARATYMHLKGNTFYTWKEALAFALKKKGGSVISTPIAILLIAFFTGLGGVVVGLLGRIPVVGELGVSLFAVIWFLASLFLVFVILALALSLLLVPAILATTDDDAFEGIFQSFSILYSFPWRILLYEAILIIIALGGFGVFAFFAKKAWALMTTILIWGMGDKYADLSYAATHLLQNWIYPAVAWSRALLGDISYILFFTRDFTAIELTAVMTISSYIFAFFLAIIGGFIVCYPMAVFNAGNSIVFLILKKKKDDENLLERKDREEEEEEEPEGELAEPVEEKEEAPAEKKKKAKRKKSTDSKE